MSERASVLVVSLGTTGGWRAAAEELVGALRRAGVQDVALAQPASMPRVRTFALTDLTQALGARRAACTAIERSRPAAVVYCSITAALLWPMPGAIWLDAVAAENRPGRHGVWQRRLERTRLEQAPLVMTMAPRSLEPVADIGLDPVLVPVPVQIFEDTRERARDIDAVTYAGDPKKKRLEAILDAWSRARRDHETLVVAGSDQVSVKRSGVSVVGRLAALEYRNLLRRAKLFLAAPRREDYGIAPLEALANGCQLVTTPAPGPYPALELARQLDDRLVDENLARAIRAALDDPLPAYAARAVELLAPFSHDSIDQTIRSHVLPRLLPHFASASS